MGLAHEGPFPVVEAGVYPPELWVACKSWGVTPGSLLDWAVKRYEVVLILGSGMKVSVSVKGNWENVVPLVEEMPLDAGRRRKTRAGKW